MELLDYLPILVVFLSAIVGITGETWDAEKSGLAKLTLKGRIVIAIACISLVYGMFITYDTHKKLDQKVQLALLADQQLLDGIAFILKPLCSGYDSKEDRSIKHVFAYLRDENNLNNVGHTRLMDDVGGSIVVNTKQGYKEVKHVYQLFDEYIDAGEKLINASINKYSAVLEVEDLINIDSILQDEFFTDKYRLSGRRSYFELGLLDERKVLRRAVLRGSPPACIGSTPYIWKIRSDLLTTRSYFLS
jgi:hypothetical protein